MAKKKLTKNLANCTPREFLSQTNKIRKSAQAWLKATDIMNIRRNVPKLENIPADASSDDIDRIMDEHKKAVRDAAIKNFKEMLDSILDKHPEETLDLLALLNFIEPSDLDNYTMSEILRNATEIMNNEDVIGFFTSLMRMEKLNILN